MHQLSVVVASRGYALVVVCGLLTVVASLAGEHGLYMQFQQLWHMGFIAI